MGNYRHRIVDEILLNRVGSAGAVVLEGAKWCGKTTTCEQIALFDRGQRAFASKVSDGCDGSR